MIDLQVLRDDPDAVRRSQVARGSDPGAVDRLLAAIDARRAATTTADTLRAEAKKASEAVRGAAPDTRAAAIEHAKQLKAQVEGSEAARDAADGALTVAHKAIDNVVEAEVPPGGEDDFVVLEVVGEIPTFEFPVRDHVEIGLGLKALDLERGVKVSGSRFAFLTGVGALLELALVRMATEHALAAGFTPVVPPVLVLPSAMEGTGFLGAHSAEVYRLADDDLYLVGTSEVPLAAMHAGEVLDELPTSYAAFSSCFRREAGSAGKDTRGLIRVHQFDKVEMFVWCDPADAREQHQRLLAAEKAFLTALELPFHVIDVAAGDLGSSAARKFDCEAWIPSQGTYRELTSTSNCTTFQARRLGVRRRTPTGPAPVATLNGTLCAIGRTIVAVLENHQQADGSVRVPEALRPYLGRDVLTPA